MFSIHGHGIAANITRSGGNRGPAQKRIPRLMANEIAVPAVPNVLNVNHWNYWNCWNDWNVFLRIYISEDHIGSFFPDHVHGADDKEARNARKYRGIDDPQSCGAVHFEIAG
jgi:hypothetical protein